MKNEIKKLGKLKLNKETLNLIKGGEHYRKADHDQKKGKKTGTRCKRCCTTYD